MAFSRLMLTTDGRILYAKYGQGKAPHFTRVAIGDGVLGTGSLVNRKTLINERLSLPIDAILRINDDTDVAVIATLKNDLLEEGIYFREISVWAKDPDTSKDVLCLIDNAGADAEYIPDANSGVKISERLKLITTVENASNISFNPGGNPLYLTGDDIDDTQSAAYSLWSSKKVSDELAKKATKAHTHTPGEAGADPAGSAAGATAAHNTNATAHLDIRNAIASAQTAADEARSLAEGRSRAVTYPGYSAMVAAVNLMTKTAMRVGDNLLLEALGIPDLWVYRVETSAVVYQYTTDDALVTALMSGPVQMGYYKMSMLETPKVDLSGYVPTARTINGKPLTANITLTAGDVGARADTWFPTAAEMGLGKTLTFTGAVSGTYNGTADKTIDIPEAGGKRTCRFVVGTSTAGWTAKDCDYLCDGTDDQVEINAAIQALPATGGEVVVLDGEYNITAAIAITKSYTKLSGNGNATVLKRMWNSIAPEGVIQVANSKTGIKIEGLRIEGNMNQYSNGNNIGLHAGEYAYNNTIAGNFVSRCSGSGMYVGKSCYAVNIKSNNLEYAEIRLESCNSATITNNYCTDGNTQGIYLISCTQIEIKSNTVKNKSSAVLVASSNKISVCQNMLYNNGYGVRLETSINNLVAGNFIMRVNGNPTDYSDYQHTIYLIGTANNYNLIVDNFILGKNYSSGGGTGNTFVNNKYN